MLTIEPFLRTVLETGLIGTENSGVVGREAECGNEDGFYFSGEEEEEKKKGLL